MNIDELKFGDFLTYIPSGEIVTVEHKDDWSATLRHTKSGTSTMVNSSEGLSLYKRYTR